MTNDRPATLRDAVIHRYSDLARTALAGGAPVDCDRDARISCPPEPSSSISNFESDHAARSSLYDQV